MLSFQMFFITGSATSQQRKTKKCAYSGEWVKETMTCM